jgi:tetratricopeptide (TPR) repeat protein
MPKVVARVSCDGVELKLTLTPKFLEKTLAAALIGPFLGAFNKKRPDKPPVTVEELRRVEVNGKSVAPDEIASKAFGDADSPQVVLHPPWSNAPMGPKSVADAKPPPAPAPAPAPAPTGPTKVPNKAPAPAPAPEPAAAAEPELELVPPPKAPEGTPMASNTMPKCKYGIRCRIITPEEECTTKLPKEQQHWYKFQHPCFWVCKEGHPELGPPGVKCPLDPKLGPKCMASMIKPCTNFDPDHRRCFRHPEDDAVCEEVIDETPDELDEAVVRDEAAWTAPEIGSVGDDEAMEAKMAAVEAAGNGDWAGAVAGYSKALAAAPSALTYAKRAEALLKLGHPTAACADCKAALELNPDSAKSYKVMGKAMAKTGDWSGAFKALCMGNKMDQDDDTYELQKKLAAKLEKAKKLKAQKARLTFVELGLEAAWAAIEPQVLQHGRGEASLGAIKAWHEAEPEAFAKKLEELNVDGDKRSQLLAKVLLG